MSVFAPRRPTPGLKLGAMLVACLCMLAGARAVAQPATDLSAWNPALDAPRALTDGWRRIDNQRVAPVALEALLNSTAAVEARVPTTWLNGAGAGSAPQATYALKLQGLPTHTPMALYVRQLCGAADVFFYPASRPATAPVASLGRQGTSTDTHARLTGGRWVPIQAGSDEPHYLVIQVSERYGLPGGLCRPVFIGSYEHLQKLAERNVLVDGFVATLMLSIAAFTIGLFLQRPREKSYLWLALAGFSISIVFLGQNGLLGALFNSDEYWVFELGYRLTFACVAMTSTLLLMYFRHTFEAQWIHRYLPLNFIPSMIAVLVIFYVDVGTLATLAPALWIFLSVQFVQAIAMLGIGTARGDRRAQVALMATIPLLGLSAWDGYLFWHEGALPSFSAIGLATYFYVLSHIASHGFMRTLQAAENLLEDMQSEIKLHTANINEKNQRLEEAQQALQEANENLRTLSITDGLTKAYNRMFFEQSLEKEWRRCGRDQQPLSVILLDADFFKRLNDTAGHLVGDQCLRELSKVMRAHFKRAGELVARYGGEEFLVMLPNTSQEEAVAAAERLRAAIEVHPIVYEERTYHVTTSLGVATRIPDNSMTPEALVGLADEALYQSKANGRNRVTAWSPSIATGEHH